MKQRNGWGGARHGAGRPKTGKRPRTNLSIMVDAGLKKKLKALSKKYGESVSEIVNNIIRWNVEDYGWEEEDE